MTAKNVAEFGNLLITFGEGEQAKGMLDVPELVLPAFFSGEAREFKGASYFIHQAELVDLGDDRTAIAFEFLKVHELKSEQQWTNDGIARKERNLPNDAPSAVGVLVLNTHRLVYVGKTANAPSVGTFAGTIRHHVMAEYMKKIAAVRRDAARGTKDDAQEGFQTEIPKPNVEYVRIMGRENVADAIRAFKIVRRMTLSVHAPNPDEYTPGSKVLANMRALRSEADAKKTVLTHSNPDGLKPAAVTRQLTDAAEDEHTTAKLEGINNHGADETWDDQKLTLRVPLSDIDLSLAKRAAKPLVELMQEELKHLPARSAVAARKVRDAVQWVRTTLGKK